MSIEIKFPERGHMDVLGEYANQSHFKKKMNEICQQEYGRSDAFVYNLFATINNERHTWKCSQENCESALIYHWEANEEKYMIKDITVMHQHKSASFEFFCQKKLKEKMGNFKTFNFPREIGSLNSLQDEDEIRATLENQWYRQYPGYALGFTVRKSHNEVNKMPELIFQCRYKTETFLDHTCQWQIVFSYDAHQKKWILNRHNVIHEHYINMERREIFRNEQNGFPTVSMAELTGNTSFPKHKYGQRFIDGYTKVFEQPQRPLYQVLKLGLKTARKYHMQIRYKNRNQLLSNDEFVDIEEDLLVISSKMMKFMCKSYGKVVHMKKQKFYQNEESINERTKKKEDVYSIVTFYGFNHGYSVVVFGFALVRNFTIEKGVRILQKFKNNYLHTLEALIVNENDLQMKKVAETYPQSKKTFHICIRSIPKNTVLDNFINDASKGQLEVQVKKYVMVSEKELDESIFSDQSTKHWFTSYNQCFLGLDFELDGPKQLDVEHVKEVAGESNITTFEYQLQNLIREANDLNSRWFISQKEKSKFELLFMGRDDIKKCRLMMGKRPFQKFIQQLMLVPTVTILGTDSETFYLIGDESYPYIVTKKQDKWHCECDYSKKTGIGCVHELKVAVIRGLHLFETVSMFWIMDQAIINLQPNPQKANNPYTTKRKRRIGRKKLIA